VVRADCQRAGDWFYSVAIFSFLLQLTGNAQLVAYALLMQVLPQTLIAPAAGFAKSNPARLRWTILSGFLLAGAGYVALGTVAWSLAIAALTLMVVHSGGSACWTSSTTLLQQQTEDRFRGRVFSAKAAGMTLALSASSFIAGRMVDAGVDPRTVAIGAGVVTLIPAGLWLAGTRR
jgi:hypothetical protein